MTFLEKLEVIERIDGLIRRKATGNAKSLAERVGVSRSHIFNILNTMKDMGAPIEYCSTRESYYYEYNCDLMIGFIDNSKIKGGFSMFYCGNMSNPSFLDYTTLY